MSKTSRRLREVKKEFYMSFFLKEEGFEEKEINGFWLIKHWDGNLNKWTVDLYSKESYKNFKGGSNLFNL